MSIITGFLTWNEGDVFINGHNLKTKTKLARKSISLCPQHNVLYNELNAVEHLYLYCVIKGESSYRIEYDIGVSFLSYLLFCLITKTPIGRFSNLLSSSVKTMNR